MLLGTSSLVVHGDYEVIMIGESSLEVQPENEALLVGESEMWATANDELVIGEGYIQGVTGRGGEGNITHGYGLIPSVIGSGEGGFHVPTPTVIAAGTLAKIGGSGVMTTVHVGTHDSSIPSVFSHGGEGNYGKGSGLLSPVQAFGVYGLPNDEAEMIDFMIAGGTITSTHVLTVVFVSEGTVTDTISLTRVQAVEFISQLEQSDIMTVLGTFTESFIETLTAVDRNSQNVITTDGNTEPDLDTEGMVWVVNTETGASSQYEQYGFNSFFNRPSDGKSYGICSSGIYRLNGDTDAGADISALADFGRSDYGTSHKKKIPYIYLGVGSNGVLYLKVDSDGESYIYEMRNSSTAVKNHRVDVGKGLHGNYWNPVLMNKDGADFDLNAIQFEPIVSSRRI